MARLRTHVHVDGQVYGPDDDVPDKVARLITNPKAWDEPPTEDPEVTEQSSEEPPRAGKGSSLDSWMSYAQSQGIEVPEGASRDDVIAAVDAAKE